MEERKNVVSREIQVSCGRERERERVSKKGKRGRRFRKRRI